KYKFKYGALGHTVTLASRVEGATKQFGVPLLLTGATRELLGPAFPTRRLATVRVVGIAGSVDLCEPWPEDCSLAERAYLVAFEAALKLYEAGRFDEARAAAEALRHPTRADVDPPTRLLLARIEDAQPLRPEPFDPVLELTSK